jgi:hypothetical protein
MLFKWDYSPVLGRTDNATHLMLGPITVGIVYRTGAGLWRSECYLPDSGDYGSHFIEDSRRPASAKILLEKAAVDWVNKTGLWHLPVSSEALSLPDETQ